MPVRGWPLQMASRILGGGGVIACPTEGVWGLSCDPFDADAARRLLGLKGRSPDKGLLLVAVDATQLAGLVDCDLQRLTSAASQEIRPTTWVVDASSAVPPWVTGGRTSIAVRLTRHPLLAALCQAWGGPLISTSANHSGCPPARNGVMVRRYFPGIDMVLEGALGGENRPSQIIELNTGKVLRG